MDYQTIAFDQPEPGLGLLTLNRPERLNAISLDMLDELHDLLGRLADQKEPRVIIVTGAGRGFCSGADLRDERMASRFRELFSHASVHLTEVQKKYSRLVLEIRRLPQPVIAAVNGPAAGGGFCLALAADVILAGPEAAFTPSFINIGLSGGEMGSTYFLPRRVGFSRAAEILMTGRTVGAAEAERIGLASRLVPGDGLLGEAFDLARVMLDKNPLGLRLTKESLALNLDAQSFEAAVDLEDRCQAIGSTSPDFHKAVINFAQRRK